ncbi:hypothetical protein EDD21DRAFT_404805 [Dissophora ornata]|nr:hypothetical protein EDD21DRAFT_404805 [Dissophora ornata]
MSTDDLWQQLQSGHKTFDITVYPGDGDTQGVPYVLLEDIQDHFPDAANFMCGRRLVSYMRDANKNRLMPLRFAHLPGMAITFSTSKSGVPQESAPLSPPLSYSKDNQEKVIEKALKRLAVIQGRVEAILTQTYELHEYPIPRLFIVLPKKPSNWDPVNILNNQFRLHFLCECGEHTRALDDKSSKIQHHIHVSKHDGYDLQRPKEFFQKYGRYILTLLEMIKYGVTIAGIVIPALAAVSAHGANDRLKGPLKAISEADVNQAIEYLQCITDKDSDDLIKDNQAESFAGLKALEGAGLRHLEAFIKSKDNHRVLGNLYRIISHDGHVKWICIDHFRSTYQQNEQQAFADIVGVNGGSYDPRLGEVVINLESKFGVAQLYGALAKAKCVDELDITFSWKFSTSDLQEFEGALKESRISILRLDLRRFQTSHDSKLFSESTRYEILSRIIEHPNMKIIHMVLQMTSPSHLRKLSFELRPDSIGRNELELLAEALKTSSTLTTLTLETHFDVSNSIGDEGAQVLSEALKTNSTLTTLKLGGSSIGENGAVVLSEALKTNSTLTTLNLWSNSTGENGAVALSEALKTNSALTTLNLRSNSIRNNGAVSLSEALKTNSALTALYLGTNSIGGNGAVALFEALKTNSTLTTLNLWSNSIKENGAVALSEALKINSALATLDLGCNSIREKGAVALSEALKINSTLTTLNLWSNSTGENGAVALSEALKTNSALTILHLGGNLIKDNGAVALSEALKTNSTLTTLYLSGNLIRENGAVALSEALKINSTLTTLNLLNNSIKEKGAVVFKTSKCITTF